MTDLPSSTLFKKPIPILSEYLDNTDLFCQPKGMIQKKVMIKSGAMLAAALLGIILIGQLHKCATKNEPVWATGGKTVVWDKASIPLAVCPLEEPFDYAASLKSAVTMFNGQVGFKLFEYKSGSEVDCDVVVTTGAIEVDTKLAEDSTADAWLKTSSPQVVFIVLRRPEDINKVAYVFQHELGHAVGLAHDPAGKSIMYIKASDGTGLMDNQPDAYPMVSDRDRDALRTRYK